MYCSKQYDKHFKVSLAESHGEAHTQHHTAIQRVCANADPRPVRWLPHIEPLTTTIYTLHHSEVVRVMQESILTTVKFSSASNMHVIIHITPYMVRNEVSGWRDVKGKVPVQQEGGGQWVGSIPEQFLRPTLTDATDL